jgi:opacity protein-like surface antigen
MPRVFAFLSLLLLTSAAFAQTEYPRAEVFAGYSYLHIDTQGIPGSSLDAVCNSFFVAGSCPAGTFQVHSGFNGWNAAAQVNANRWWGLKADLSGHYGTPIALSSVAITYLNSVGVTGLPPKENSFSYLFGPVVSGRFSRYTVFGHALFGANREGVNIHLDLGRFQIPAFTVSHTALAMAFGGGIDVKVAPHLAIRGQADYLYTAHDFTGLIPGLASHQNNVRASVGIVYRFGRSERVGAAPTQNLSGGSSAGMSISPLGITVATGSNLGAEITDEAPHGAAALAGLHPGDVINTVDGKPVKTPMELAAELSNRPAGDKVRLGYLLHGSWQIETVVLLAH